MFNCIIYIRTNKQNVKEAVADITASMKVCFDHAEKHNLQIVDVFSDVGSANAEMSERPGLEMACRSVADGCVLLVPSVDKLTRDARQFLHTETVIRMKGGRLMVVDYQWEDTAPRKLMEALQKIKQRQERK